tara:strand:+ start:136 stop:393 length:258 start_codon:yes stop_codon:yes gene_type:complete
MTEKEKQRIFLERAAYVLGERVLQLDDIIQQKIYASLEDLYFEKEDPLQTIDEEFEGVYELITEHVFPQAFVEVNKILREQKIKI